MKLWKLDPLSPSPPSLDSLALDSLSLALSFSLSGSDGCTELALTPVMPRHKHVMKAKTKRTLFYWRI